METLTINIPDQKVTLVKQILEELGVSVEPAPKKELTALDYASRIKISKEDALQMIKDIEQSRNEWDRGI